MCGVVVSGEMGVVWGERGWDVVGCGEMGVE